LTNLPTGLLNSQFDFFIQNPLLRLSNQATPTTKSPTSQTSYNSKSAIRSRRQEVVTSRSDAR